MLYRQAPVERAYAVRHRWYSMLQLPAAQSLSPSFNTEDPQDSVQPEIHGSNFTGKQIMVTIAQHRLMEQKTLLARLGLGLNSLDVLMPVLCALVDAKAPPSFLGQNRLMLPLRSC